MPDRGKRWGAYVTVMQRIGGGAAPGYWSVRPANAWRNRPKARM